MPLVRLRLMFTAKNLALAGIFAVAATHPAFAIPSPELIVGSISSVSQIVTLLAAMLGGGAAIVGARSASFDRKTRVATATLALILVGSLAFNAHQWLDRRQERAAHLEATLLRPAQTPGVPKLDPDLKELTYAQQLKHPMGLDTAAAETLLAEAARGEHPDTVFIDVRETAETEMGNLPGALAVRYPDFSAAKLDLANKKPVLFCHNGNRSHETCEALAALGIPCQFIIGGLEKWVVEKRGMTGMSTRSIEDLRAIPTYPNQRTLLDTEHVHGLVTKLHAMFVDIRYPGEFAAGHLPDAINLSIRRQPTTVLQSQIASLPRRPVIMPCYDRRGCFFAEVLGLELARAGFDVRGRYTVPSEYFVPSGRPPHVDKFIADSQRSLWSKARDGLAEGVALLSAQFGFAASIALLALISRLLVLPLSLKAERDQLISATLKAEVAALAARTRHDARLRARSMQALYRRHGLTPVRNVLALAFLPIMTLTTAAIQQTAARTPVAWAWISDPAQRDPSMVLPIVFGVLVAIYLHLSVARTPRHRLLVWALVAPALTAIAVMLGAAVDLYLVVSLALLLAQRTLAAGEPAKLRRWQHAIRRRWHQLRLPGGVVSLADPGHLAGRGNKAYRLAVLSADGIAVPSGVLLTAEFLLQIAAMSPRRRRRLLTRTWRMIGARSCAVRSSAAAEDGVAQSFAGVFDSVLHVERSDLEAAITRVAASFHSERAAGYGFAAVSGNILLQAMVAAEYSGVLFTRDPASVGTMLVELVAGTADALVAGTVTPTALRFGRISLAPVGLQPAPIDLAALLAIGRRAEVLFGRPQDIEWTYSHGRFQIVQSRDITNSFSDYAAEPVEQLEWDRVLTLASAQTRDTEAVVFAQSELSELLPRPTPLSLALQNSFWSSGGSVDLACRRLGLEYRITDRAPDYVVGILGRLYVDKRQEKVRAPLVSGAARKRIEKAALLLESEYRDHVLPRFVQAVTVLEAADFDRMELPSLVATIGTLHARFIGETHVEVAIVNIAAHLFAERTRAELQRLGLDPTTCLAGAAQPQAQQAVDAALSLHGAEQVAAIGTIMGHRAALDYELSMPRFCEDAKALATLTMTLAATSVAAPAAPTAPPRELIAAVERARRFQSLKEDAKHQSLRELAVLRRAVVALDRKLNFAGLAFYLTFAELTTISATSAEALRGTAARRRSNAAILADVVAPPATLTISDIERAAAGHVADIAADPTALRGTRVAGTRVGRGRCYLVSTADAETGAALVGFQPGDIIVARMFHPAWLPYLRQCNGIVAELGGWLSHMAILAREHDIPMIVGVRALTTLPDRAHLRLLEDGSIDVDDAAAADAALTRDANAA